MLIRSLDGNVFHVVCGESKNKRQYLCLCGQLLEKRNLGKQSSADERYSRCWDCQKLQNEMFKAHHPGRSFRNGRDATQCLAHKDAQAVFFDWRNHGADQAGRG